MGKREITEVYYYSYYYSRRVDWGYKDTVTLTVRGKTFTFKPKIDGMNIAYSTEPYDKAYDILYTKRQGTLAPSTNGIPTPFKLKCSKSSMNSEITDIILENTRTNSSDLNPVNIEFYYTYCDNYSYKNTGCGVDWWDLKYNKNKKGNISQISYFNAREDPQDVSSWTVNTGGGGGSTGGGT